MRRVYPIWTDGLLPINPRIEEFERAIEEASDNLAITDDDETRLRVTDLLVRAQRKSDRSTLWFAVEASGSIDDGDITRARHSADVLRKIFGQDAMPLVYGYHVSGRSRNWPTSYKSQCFWTLTDNQQVGLLTKSSPSVPSPLVHQPRAVDRLDLRHSFKVSSPFSMAVIFASSSGNRTNVAVLLLGRYTIRWRTHHAIRRQRLARTDRGRDSRTRSSYLRPAPHFWDFRTERIPHQRYLLHELADDVNSGHNVRSTVFVEARAMYRSRRAGRDKTRR